MREWVRKIARISYLGQIKNIEKVVTRVNYKRSAPARVGILACSIGRAKEVAVSESHEIARVAYLGQITSIGRSRAQKL